jgi:putative transposase
MTEVVDGVDTAEVGRPRRDRDEPRLVDPEMVDRLISEAREQGVDVAGAGWLFAQLAKTVLERSAAELTDHLGYEEGDPAGIGSGNSRNGSTPKKLATEVGVHDLEVPRDRNGSFEPQTVRKGQRRREGIDTLVIGLYGRGLTLSAIQAQLKETFDLDVSRELLSKITDSVMEEVKTGRAGRWTPSTRSSSWTRWSARSGRTAPCATRPRTWPSGSTPTARRRSSGSGSRPPRAPASGPG